MSIALPRFHVLRIDRGDSSVILRGTVSSTTVGRETWVGDRHLGYLKHEAFLAPGRWRAAQDSWEFVLEQLEHAGQLEATPDLEVLDGYWGERAELALNAAIVWNKSQWTKDSDHDHCAICWATVSVLENSRHFVAATGERVCSLCYRDYVDRRELGFISTASQQADAADGPPGRR